MSNSDNPTPLPYLLTAEEIETREGLSKIHFMNPNARRINKSLGDWTGLTGIGVHLIEVAPGHESTELHRHHHEDECVYVLAGEADAVIGDETHRVKAGDFLGYRAGGEPHKLVNTGSEPLRCLVIGQRLEHDVGDYPDQKKRLYRNRGVGWDLVDWDDLEHPKGGRKA